MSSSDRRSVLLSLAALPALGACGFTPAYAPGGAAGSLRGRVLVDEPATRNGYLMTRDLEGRLGRAGGGARYGLSLGIQTRRDGGAISQTDITTRYNLIGSATYALRDIESGKVLTSGSVETFTGYSATGSTVATQAAARDAEARLMTMLSDQIVTRLLAAAPDLPA